MLRKRQRLSSAGFSEVFKAGRRLHTAYFQLIYLPSEDFHASVVVGKKVAKTAVRRNRLRRQVYGVLHRSAVGTPLSVTVIVVAKPALAMLASREVVAAAAAAVAQLRSR